MTNNQRTTGPLSNAAAIVAILVVSLVIGGVIALVQAIDLHDLMLPALVGLGVLVLWRLAVGALGAWDWMTSRQLEHQAKRLELAKAHLDLALVQPDYNGLLPVARQLLESGAIANQTLLLAAQHVANGQPVQPVPHSISYTPHMITKNDVRAEGTAQPAMPPAVQPKSFLELFNAGALPADRFLMGYSLEDGEPVTATWRDLYSALIGGQSGSGKSTLIRNVLAQSALQGGRFVVLDPHYSAGEESLGQSLQPLRSRLLCDVAASEAQMIDALRFVRETGQRRLLGQDADKTPIILVVDETTSLLSRSGIADELSDVLGMIAQETRKVGVYAMCIGQQFKSQIMDTSVRNSFVSMLSCKARRDVARVMSGNQTFAQMTESLRIGEAVWMRPSGDVTKIAVPNCTEDMIEIVAQTLEKTGKTAPSSFQVVEALHNPLHQTLHTTLETQGNRLIGEAPVLDGKAARIAQLFKSGESKSQIIADVFGVQSKSGKAYMEAAQQFDNIIRALLP